MKKLFLLSLLSAIGTSTFAASNCSILYAADDNLVDIIQKNNFNFDNYEDVCQHLRNAKARIKLSYMTGTSDQETTTVVIATVKDKNLPIESHTYTRSMWNNSQQDGPVAESLIMNAVNHAVSNINQKDIDGLNASRKKLGFKTYPASTSTNKK